jgi:hypothetical protein
MTVSPVSSRHSDDSLRDAWNALDQQGNVEARARGRYCVVADVATEADALAMTRLAVEWFAIPSCAHYDGKSLSFYCGAAGTSGYLSLMAHVEHAWRTYRAADVEEIPVPTHEDLESGRVDYHSLPQGRCALDCDLHPRTCGCVDWRPEPSPAFPVHARMREGTTLHDGGIYDPSGCPRGRPDCSALSRIASPNYESFFCCGETNTSSVPTDRLRFCVKSTHDRGPVDVLVNFDERDTVHACSVLMGGLAALGSVQINAIGAEPTG